MIWLPLLALTAGVAIVAVSKPKGTSTGARPPKGRARVGRPAVNRCLPFAWQPEAIDEALEHVLSEHRPPVGDEDPSVGAQAWSRDVAPPTAASDPFDEGEVALYQSTARARRRRRRRVSVGAPGGWNEVEIARIVADRVYNHTPDGESIHWPPVPDDCLQVKAIWGRTVIRVRRHLAAIEDGAAEAAWYDAGGR